VDTSDTELIEALGSSQRLGFLGDQPIPDVVAHARRFVGAIETWCPLAAPRIADIGSGGGVPGLVVAQDLPAARLVLIDRRATRVDHVSRLVRRLGWDARVEVIAADLTNPPDRLVGAFDVVTARGFGPPAATLAAAAALLVTGGLVLVSEPPRGTADRWVPELLEAHDLVRCSEVGADVVVFRRP
jgi:16S rRNA (guanine527-N7)-methyltransferase